MILDEYLKKYSNSIKSDFPENLKNIEEIKPCIQKYQNLSFYGKNNIIPEKILKMIQKNIFNDKQLLIKNKKMFANKNDIFIQEDRMLTIGNLNKEFVFIPKYMLNYQKVSNLY